MASTFTILQAGRSLSYTFQVNIDTLNTDIILKEAHIYGDTEDITLSATQVSSNSIQIDITSNNTVVQNPNEIPLTVAIDFGTIDTGDYISISLNGEQTITSAWSDHDLLECVLPSTPSNLISYDIECVKEKSPYFTSTVDFTDEDFPYTIRLSAEILGNFQ